jgi:DNA-binding NarL/FixJ family response regulator
MSDARTMTDRNLRVLVVDDHQVVHWGLRLMLGRLDWVERVVPAASGEQAAEFARRYEPHVALVDLFVGEESGTEIVGMIRTASPATRALLYSGAGRLSAKAARAAGAHGFITKERDASELADAIRRVGRGLTFFDEATPSGMVLTDRERQVLERVAGGMTNAEIATELHLSPNTVKQHASGMFRKIGARNRTEAVQRAQRLGLIS